VAASLVAKSSFSSHRIRRLAPASSAISALVVPDIAPRSIRSWYRRR